MFAKAEVIPLFPTSVWAYERKSSKDLNQRLIAAIEELRAAMPSVSPDSGTWQSVGDLHERPPFQDFMEMVIDAASGVFEFLRIRSEGIIVTNCWANVNSRGHAHHRHSHPNNLLSGVYYAKIPPDSGKIVFIDPRPQANVMIPAVSEYTPQNSAKHTFEVAEGRLLLFPSWLEHYVEAHGAQVERISIAFNLVPKGRMGVESGFVDL